MRNTYNIELKLWYLYSTGSEKKGDQLESFDLTPGAPLTLPIWDTSLENDFTKRILFFPTQ